MTTEELSARLDRLPLSGFHRRIMFVLAFAFFFELADLNTFAYAAPALVKYMHLSVHTIATITSASFFGMFVGASIGGWLSDRLGRRRALLFAVPFYSVFSLANAVAQNVTQLFSARFLTGVGLSAMTAIAITYLAELMPKAVRGRMQAATLGLGLFGIPVMAFISRAVVPTGPDGWRWVFVFGSLGIVFLILGQPLVESPRWLSMHGRSADAAATLARIEAEVSIPGTTLPEVRVEARRAEAPRPGIGALFSGLLLRRTVVLWIAWIFQTLGFYGFMAWVPTLLAAHGFDLVRSLTWSAVLTLGAVPGAFCAWPISDRFGRRGPIVVVSLVIAAAGVAYGLSFTAAGIMVFGFMVAFFIQTFAALLYAYTPELYPTALRNAGTGFAYGVGRLANIFGPLIVAAIFSRYGYTPVFVYIAATWVIVALAVGILGPTTGELSLEQIAARDATVGGGPNGRVLGQPPVSHA